MRADDRLLGRWNGPRRRSSASLATASDRLDEGGQRSRVGYVIRWCPQTIAEQKKRKKIEIDAECRARRILTSPIPSSDLSRVGSTKKNSIKKKPTTKLENMTRPRKLRIANRGRVRGGGSLFQRNDTRKKKKSFIDVVARDQRSTAGRAMEANETFSTRKRRRSTMMRVTRGSRKASLALCSRLVSWNTMCCDKWLWPDTSSADTRHSTGIVRPASNLTQQQEEEEEEQQQPRIARPARGRRCRERVVGGWAAPVARRGGHSFPCRHLLDGQIEALRMVRVRFDENRNQVLSGV